MTAFTLADGGVSLILSGSELPLEENLNKNDQTFIWGEEDVECVPVYRRSEGLGESSVWNPDVSLQELDHRQREGQLICPLLHFCPGQAVLHHELSQVTHDLGGRSHLRERENDTGVSTKLMRDCLNPFFCLGRGEWGKELIYLRYSYFTTDWARYMRVQLLHADDISVCLWRGEVLLFLCGAWPLAF